MNALTSEGTRRAAKAQQAQWHQPDRQRSVQAGQRLQLIRTRRRQRWIPAQYRATDYFPPGADFPSQVQFTTAQAGRGIHRTQTAKRGTARQLQPLNCMSSESVPRLGKRRFCIILQPLQPAEATGIDLPGEIRRNEYYDRGDGVLSQASAKHSTERDSRSILLILTAVCAVCDERRGGSMQKPRRNPKITRPGHI